LQQSLRVRRFGGGDDSILWKKSWCCAQLFNELRAVSRSSDLKVQETVNLFESFVVDEAGGVLGKIELPFLQVFAKLPGAWRSTSGFVASEKD